MKEVLQNAVVESNTQIEKLQNDFEAKLKILETKLNDSEKEIQRFRKEQERTEKKMKGGSLEERL